MGCGCGSKNIVLCALLGVLGHEARSLANVLDVFPQTFRGVLFPVGAAPFSCMCNPVPAGFIFKVMFVRPIGP